MSDIAIQTQGLTKIFKEVTKGGLVQKTVVALEDLNLEVYYGEVFAFIGPNGAGKTTTIKLLTRLIYPTKGKIWISGQPNSSKEAMNCVGYLPEQPNLYGHLSGREFLDFIGRIFGLDSKIRKRKIDELIDDVGLKSRADHRIQGYSRGMIQRLGLAQALLNDPTILILDEPMSNLDPLGRKEFRDRILTLKKEGKTIFFSSHILSDAEMVADRIGMLNQGRLIHLGCLDEMVDQQVKVIEVTFTLDPERIQKLNLKKSEMVLQGQKVMVRIEDANRVKELIRRVDHLGGNIISVVPQRYSLEDIFMAELGR